MANGSSRACVGSLPNLPNSANLGQVGDGEITCREITEGLERADYTFGSCPATPNLARVVQSRLNRAVSGGSSHDEFAAMVQPARRLVHLDPGLHSIDCDRGDHHYQLGPGARHVAILGGERPESGAFARAVRTRMDAGAAHQTGADVISRRKNHCYEPGEDLCPDADGATAQAVDGRPVIAMLPKRAAGWRHHVERGSRKAILCLHRRRL